MKLPWKKLWQTSISLNTYFQTSKMNNVFFAIYGNKLDSLFCCYLRDIEVYVILSKWHVRWKYSKQNISPFLRKFPHFFLKVNPYSDIRSESHRIYLQLRSANERNMVSSSYYLLKLIRNISIFQWNLLVVLSNTCVNNRDDIE